MVFEYYDFYENQILYNIFYDIQSIFGYDSLHEIGDYDQLFRYYIYPIDTIMSPLNQVKASLLYKNGLSIDFVEGYGYLSPDANFLLGQFSDYLTEEDLAFYTLKSQEYYYSPIISDGGITVELTTIADMLIQADYLYENGDLTLFDSHLEHLIGSYFNMLAIYDFDNTSRYYNGYLSPNYFEAFRYMIEQYPDTYYGIIFENMYAIYEVYDFKPNQEVIDYLDALGYDVTYMTLNE